MQLQGKLAGAAATAPRLSIDMDFAQAPTQFFSCNASSTPGTCPFDHATMPFMRHLSFSF
jgi:hypothetical protein